MAKVFNFMERSAELFDQGIPDEEAVRIMEKEADEADFCVIDDGAWWADLEAMRREVEEEVDADLRAQGYILAD